MMVLLTSQVGSELCPSFPESFNYQNVPIDDVEDEDIVVHLQRPLEYIGAGRQKGGLKRPLVASSRAAESGQWHALHLGQRITAGSGRGVRFGRLLYIEA
jgi:hypothetical protein